MQFRDMQEHMQNIIHNEPHTRTDTNTVTDTGTGTDRQTHTQTTAMRAHPGLVADGVLALVVLRDNGNAVIGGGKEQKRSDDQEDKCNRHAQHKRVLVNSWRTCCVCVCVCVCV